MDTIIDLMLLLAGMLLIVLFCIDPFKHNDDNE